jgi:hypothetical protein
MYSVVAAILYLLSTAVFLERDNYTQIYILYIGNVLFAAVRVVFILMFYKKRIKNADYHMMMVTGLITTVKEVLISSSIIFILLTIMKPSASEAISHRANELAKPGPSLLGNSHTPMFVLFREAVFGNLGAGSFVYDCRSQEKLNYLYRHEDYIFFCPTL